MDSRRTVLITGACINTGVAIVEKFASEGFDIVFTGRNSENVHAAEAKYKEQFPNVNIIGYHIDSLIDERTVDEKSVDEMFGMLDKNGIFIELKPNLVGMAEYKEGYNYGDIVDVFVKKIIKDKKRKKNENHPTTVPDRNRKPDNLFFCDPPLNMPINDNKVLLYLKQTDRPISIEDF